MELKSGADSSTENFTGYEVSLKGRNVMLGEILSVHADKSSTYRDATGDLVVHVFLDARHPENLTRLRSVSAVARGVTGYTSIGRVPIRKPLPDAGWKSHVTWKLGFSRKVWAAVRPFEPQTLKDILRSDRPLNLPPVKQWARELATGLKAIHAAGVYHGDVRPSNILLRESGGAWFADYGLLSNEEPNSHVDDNQLEAKSEMTMFSSPDVLVSGKRNSASSDIYSYGKVLKVMARQFGPVPESERELIDRISDECLSSAPEDRPTVEKILELLEPVKTSPSKFPNRNSLGAAILADMDARLDRGISPHQIHYASRMALEAVDRFLEEVKHSKSPNMIGIEDYELVHFLASAAFFINRSNKLIDLVSRDYGILNAVSFEHAPKFEIDNSLRFAESLDSQWRDEIKTSALEDGSAMDLSEAEIQDYLARQLQYAAELHRDVLDSDVFIRSDDVAAVMSASCPGISADEVRILRDLGYLISLPVDGTQIYPLFQFDGKSGLPRPCVKTISQSMNPEKSSWSRGIWWFLQMETLGNVAPVDWLREGRDELAVIRTISHNLAA